MSTEYAVIPYPVGGPLGSGLPHGPQHADCICPGDFPFVNRTLIDETLASVLRYVYVPFPHWIEPGDSGKTWRTQNWKATLRVASDNPFYEEFNGEYPVVFQAGALTSIVDGEVSVSNAPGWRTLKEALEYRHHPGEEGDYESLPGILASLLWRQTFGPRALVMEVIIGAWSPAFLATRPPDTPPPYEQWMNREGLDEVWNFPTGGRVLYYDGTLGGEMSTMTELVHYEGKPLGRDTGSWSDGAFRIDLEHNSFFDE